MSEMMFPIQSERGAAPHPMCIPWGLAERAYSVYAGRYGRSQSLERLADRGGFGPSEMDEFLPGWRDMCGQICELKTTIATLLDQISDPSAVACFDPRLLDKARKLCR